MAISSQKAIKEKMQVDRYILAAKRSKGYISGYELKRWVENKYGARSIEALSVSKSAAEKLIEKGEVVRSNEGKRWPEWSLAQK